MPSSTKAHVSHCAATRSDLNIIVDAGLGSSSSSSGGKKRQPRICFSCCNILIQYGTCDGASLCAATQKVPLSEWQRTETEKGSMESLQKIINLSSSVLCTSPSSGCQFVSRRWSVVFFFCFAFLDGHRAPLLNHRAQPSQKVSFAVPRPFSVLLQPHLVHRYHSRPILTLFYRCERTSCHFYLRMEKKT